MGVRRPSLSGVLGRLRGKPPEEPASRGDVVGQQSFQHRLAFMHHLLQLAAVFAAGAQRGFCKRGIPEKEEGHLRSQPGGDQMILEDEIPPGRGAAVADQVAGPAARELLPSIEIDPAPTHGVADENPCRLLRLQLLGGRRIKRRLAKHRAPDDRREADRDGADQKKTRELVFQSRSALRAQCGWQPQISAGGVATRR